MVLARPEGYDLAIFLRRRPRWRLRPPEDRRLLDHGSAVPIFAEATIPGVGFSECAAGFISHASKNQPLAAAVVAELGGNGIRCWMAPRDIRPGKPNYGRAIIDGLSSCQAVVLLLTDASNRSQNVMKEVERAVHKKISILVVTFQPIEVSKELEYYVSSSSFSMPPRRQLSDTYDHFGTASVTC